MRPASPASPWSGDAPSGRRSPVENPFWGVYAIVDVDTVDQRHLRVEPVAEALLAGGARVLQLRAKGRSAEETLTWLRALAPLAKRARVPLIANDRADLARLAACDGVHVGQDDLPAADVRRSFPELLLGVSTHDIDQLDVALAMRPDYVALGPVFETRTKANPDPVVGLETLQQAALRAARAAVPLVAIGGISQATVARVGAAGASPAVVGALMPDAGGDGAGPYEDIAERTRRLTVSWEGSFRMPSSELASGTP